MKPPPRIRLVILQRLRDFESGRVQQLFEHLRRDWFEPEVWLLGAPAKASLKRQIADIGLDHSLPPFTAVSTPAQLVQRLRWNSPDILYTLGASPSMLGRLFGALFGIPVVVGYGAPQSSQFERLLSRCATRFLTDTLEQKGALIRRFAIDPGQVAVISDDPMQQTEQALLEVAQLGTDWTTTSRGDLPLELPLGQKSGPIMGIDRIEERGKYRPDRSVRHVAEPTITVFLPPGECTTGTSVIICPGGGYAGITIDKEGFEVARLLATFGVAGIVLKYRLPRPDVTKTAMPMPMEDLSRAFSLVRRHAHEWNIDAERIGVMGFSAGGHMAAAAALAGSAPAFQVLVYPVISMQTGLAHRGSRRKLLGRSPSPALVDYYSVERHVTSQTPPTFLVHARDDASVDVRNSIQYAEALCKAGVPYDLLLYKEGGHGFGLARNGKEPATWPMRFISWLRSQHKI